MTNGMNLAFHKSSLNQGGSTCLQQEKLKSHVHAQHFLKHIVKDVENHCAAIA
jgi:hypothetical protein